MAQASKTEAILQVLVASPHEPLTVADITSRADTPGLTGEYVGSKIAAKVRGSRNGRPSAWQQVTRTGRGVYMYSPGPGASNGEASSRWGEQWRAPDGSAVILHDRASGAFYLATPLPGRTVVPPATVPATPTLAPSSPAATPAAPSPAAPRRRPRQPRPSAPTPPPQRRSAPLTRADAKRRATQMRRLRDQGLTYDAIGAQYGVTGTRVSQILNT